MKAEDVFLTERQRALVKETQERFDQREIDRRKEKDFKHRTHLQTAWEEAGVYWK